MPVVSLGGSISGTVYVDQTGDGLSGDDTPQQGVQVVLLAPRSHHGHHGDHDDHGDDGDHGAHGYREVAHTVTAADGSYSFSSLAAGTYIVAERLPHGWVETDPTTQRTYTVSLAAGQGVTGEDFANFQLLSTSHIRDVSFTIFDPSTGTTTTVKDLRGHTAQGDTVTVNFSVRGNTPVVVSLATYDAPSATFSAATASQQVLDSDAAGEYTKGGPYTLTVQIPNNFYQIDFVAGEAIGQFGPAGSNIFYSAEHRLISADNGGTQPIGTATISGMVFHDNDSNGVFDAGDSVIDGAQVVLVNTATKSQQSTLTASGGNYAFGALQAGTYTITVTLPDGRTLSSTVTITAGSSTTENFAAPPDNTGGVGA